MNSKSGEENRIRSVYSKRDEISPWNDWTKNIYHPRHPIGELFQEHNHRILIEAINYLKMELSGKKVLDVGCGYGNWLRYFVELGADANLCFGVDTSASRIQVARGKNNSIQWQENSLFSLPFSDSEFDLVFQSVVFSSILEGDSRKAGAVEIERVLSRNGFLIWLDLVHTDSMDLHSFNVDEIKTLFPHLKLIYKRPVHPTYFRKINGKLAFISRILAELNVIGCESQLLVFRNDAE